MHHNRVIALSAAAASATALALFSMPSADGSVEHTTLKLTNQLDTQQPVEVAPAGPSAGDSSAAIPWPDNPAAPAATQPAVGTDATRPCFLVRSNWNNALDGQQPRCTVP